MPSRTLSCLVLAGLLLWYPSPASASKILLLTGGDSSNDSALQAVLQSQGNTVTIGPTFGNFTGSDLSGYNAVMLMPNGSYWAQPDMPNSGQQALVDFVKKGGGLVAGEPVVTMWTYPGEFKTLAQAFAVQPGGANTANSPIVLTSQAADPVIGANLPSTFGIPAKGYYTETYLIPKAGATAFYTTNQWSSTVPQGTGFYMPISGAGVAGWNLGMGRVVNLSTFSDNTSLADPNYDRLLSNSVNWATRTADGSTQPFPPPSPPAVPEPTSLAVFCAAAAGLIARRWLGRARSAA
jgi:type 1 glutamine amidotransferase